ncbi:olfactory receptor 2G3-like [Talpa occidentalis]|uniref:olfactory receptor 2G3-like n=1 Tax=Talpa occidentalis TaxID=50954 RepID=UPI00188F6A69|nr:olfactory receptor 2G3-like [Talpa occidentalis]
MQQPCQALGGPSSSRTEGPRASHTASEKTGWAELSLLAINPRAQAGETGGREEPARPDGLLEVGLCALGSAGGAPGGSPVSSPPRSRSRPHLLVSGPARWAKEHRLPGGSSDHPWLEMPLSGAFLLSSLPTLPGHGSIVLSLPGPRLRTPMYFFPGNLSVRDLRVTSTIVPPLLANLRGPDKTVAFWGCVAQAYLFPWTGCTECALLAVMAYDRHVAICRPLRYTLLMPPRACVQLAAVAWVSGLANALVQATLTFQLPHCGHGRLDHFFFCEVPVLIKLACGDTTANDLSLVVGALPFVLVAPVLVLVSDASIARAVLRSPAGEGRSKALSTCSSHLAVVLMSLGPGKYMDLQPPARGASQARRGQDTPGGEEHQLPEPAAWAGTPGLERRPPGLPAGA